MGPQRRRALVTAGTRGIGAAVTASLRDAGADVFITGTTERTGEIAQELGAVGSVQADFTAPGAAEQAVTAARAVLGGVDILVANTGGPRAARFEQLSDADWDHAYSLVLDSAITITRSVLPDMLDTEWGRLIYVTSLGAVRPLPELHLSNVMRAGVAALARSLAEEVAPNGVTTHVVAPGAIDTDRTRALAESLAATQEIRVTEARQRQIQRVPAGRLGRPEEIGSLVAQLCSEDAGFQTGVTHVVDGGMGLR